MSACATSEWPYLAAVLRKDMLLVTGLNCEGEGEGEGEWVEEGGGGGRGGPVCRGIRGTGAAC